MAYRPDGGTVHSAGWGFGSPLVGAEVEGLWPFPPATPLCLHSAVEGSAVLLGAHSLSPGFLGLCHSLLCDLGKWCHLSELRFRRCKVRMSFLCCVAVERPLGPSHVTLSAGMFFPLYMVWLPPVCSFALSSPATSSK